MRGTMADVEVYYFMGWDQLQGDNLRSLRPATRKAIEVRGGTALPETMRIVDSSELDGDEFLKPDRLLR